LKIAENQYNVAKANYDAQLAQLKTQIDWANWQKNSVSQQMVNSSIKAPYNWVIISKNVEIWSTIAQGSVVFTIANSWEKIVKMDVNAENIKYLNVWKEVKLKKGSFTSTWVISLVWAWLNSNTMYPIEITFSNIDFWNNVILWDFVDVYIDEEIWSEKFIVIPFSALIATSNWVYHVFIVNENNLVIEKNVSIWASNSTEVVITSWLNIWDKIIVNGALNVNAGDKVEERENSG
jgi:hypothetical protein